MTTTEKNREEEFVERIEKLTTGELAMLRRCCGERDPIEGRCPWLLALVQGLASNPTAFLVASLLAQYKTVDIRAKRHRMNGDFGATWKRSIAGSSSESLKRRFHILLDASYDPSTGDGDLPYRLRQMVRYAVAKGVGVDWPALLKGIRSWNSPDKWVQKKWAGSYFANERPSDAEATMEEQESPC